MCTARTSHTWFGESTCPVAGAATASAPRPEAQAYELQPTICINHLQPLHQCRTVRWQGQPPPKLLVQHALQAFKIAVVVGSKEGTALPRQHAAQSCTLCSAKRLPCCHHALTPAEHLQEAGKRCLTCLAITSCWHLTSHPPPGSHSTWGPVAASASWQSEVQVNLHESSGTIMLTVAQGPTSRVGCMEGACKQDQCGPRFQQALQDTPRALAPQRAALESQPTSRKCSPSKADGMDSRIPILRALSSHRKRRLPASPWRTACRASPHSSSSNSAASRPCSQR